MSFFARKWNKGHDIPDYLAASETCDLEVDFLVIAIVIPSADLEPYAVQVQVY